jgi:hypothetical protein
MSMFTSKRGTVARTIAEPQYGDDVVTKLRERYPRFDELKQVMMKLLVERRVDLTDDLEVNLVRAYAMAIKVGDARC